MEIGDPHRLYATWLYAPAARSRAEFEAHQRWRREVDVELDLVGVLARVKAARAAVAGAEFAAAIVAAREARAAARDEADLAAVAGLVLRDLGVDMTDVVLKVKRTSRTELDFGVGTTMERATEAIAAAAARGYPPPGTAPGAVFSSAAPLTGGAAQDPQGTSEG